MSKVGEKPILFNTDMVAAILDGRKTETRRIAKVPDGTYRVEWNEDSGVYEADYGARMNGALLEMYREVRPPYQPGDVLYVRETFSTDERAGYIYKTHDRNAKILQEVGGAVIKWRPSIHMPKEAARIWLEVTDIGVERLQGITNEEAKAEGADVATDNSGQMHRLEFARVWDSTVKRSDIDRYGWRANPWVWAVKFRRRGLVEGTRC